MSDTRSFTPVSAVLPQSLWPADLFALDDSSSFLDNLACLAYDTTAEENSLKIFVKAKVMAETRLRLPFLQGISFVLSEGDGPDAGLINVDILAKTYPDAPPLIEIFMSTTVLSLSIDPQLFRPVEVKEEEGKLIVIPKEGALNIPLPFALKLKYENGEWSLDFQVPAEEEASLNIPTCMIGNTGIIFKVSGISLNLSGSADGARPQGTEAGWKGLYLKQVELYIPELFAGHIEAKGLGIGTGGFTGSISWIGNPVLKPDKSGFEKGVGSGSLFGIPFALKEVNIEFRQNSFVRSQVKGILIFPFFDQPTVVDVNLATDGDFAIALSSDQSALPSDLVPEKNGELFVFTKEGLFDLTIKGLAFERSADKFLLSINGSIKPKLRGLEWPEFEVRSLFIDSKGRIKIDGGWIDLPKQKSFDLYGFSVNITKLGFGNEENGTKWIALSGGIKLVDGLPLEGGVEGLKIKWKPPTDIKMELGGVSVAFEIKDVLKFDGSVVFMDEPPRRGFKGGVKMVLYPLDGCSLDVQLMVGKNSSIPPYNFFYTYVEAELPIGIPLFSTGLSLYGMAGLFGYNMEPSKGKPANPDQKVDPNETWYENPKGSEGFYLRPETGITHAGTKWLDNFESMGYGAGIALGTADNGFTFSAKTLIVLLIPGPVIIVEGKANFLKERKELDKDKPLFRLLAIYDGRAGTFLMNIEANYALPQDSGKVLNIHALAEAFFDFNNARNWHLYIGQDEPVAKRVRAKILSLFEANAYFMLTSRDLTMGSWVGYDNQWKFGPLRIELSAWMEGRVKITFKPAQADGGLTLQGSVQLKAFKVSLGLSVAAGVQVQTPNPFLVRAEFSVKLDLPRPLPDPKAHIVLEWKKEEAPPIPVPLAKFGLEHLKVTEKWTLDVYPNYDSNADGFSDGSQVTEPATAIQESPVIPLDARPVIVFAKPVEDAARIGDNPMPAPLPESVGGGYWYRYRLLKVILKKRPRNQNSGAWSEVAVKSHKGGAENVGELYGKWQSVLENGQQVNTKLMLWTNSAFEISRELSNNDIFTGPIVDTYSPCNLDTTLTETCVNFEDFEEQEKLPPVSIHDDITLYSKSRNSLEVVDYDAYSQFGTNKALETRDPNIYIVFSKPVAKVVLSFGKGTRLGIDAFKEDGSEPISKEGTTLDDMKAVSFEGESIVALQMWGVIMRLAKICYVTAEEMKRVEDNEALRTHIKESMALHWNQHRETLFEPNMYYKLTAVSEVMRNNEHFEFTQHSYFQTKGAPGVYGPKDIGIGSSSSNNGGASVAASDHFPSGGPLKDLAAYVKNTIPKVGQKPVYRAYDIGVIFNEIYVDQMYLIGGMSLAIELYDNNDEPVLDTDGTPISIQNHWGDNPQTFLTREEEQWIRLLNSNDCVNLNYQHKSKTKNLYAGHKRLNLKPETLYKAKVVAVSSDNAKEYVPYVVDQFSFITSKYSSFTHQIQSFHDLLWSHRRLLGSNAPRPLLTGAKKTILESILSSGSPGSSYQPDTEDKKFQQISELFGLGVRQLPASFEILALDDKVEWKETKEHNVELEEVPSENAELMVARDSDVELEEARGNDAAKLVPTTYRCYGFLIESPEPIDWNRTDLVAKHKAATTTAATGISLAQESTEAIKILGASIITSSTGGVEPGPSHNDEWLDILLREDFDISDFSIEHISAGSNNSQKFITFGKENKSFPGGTIIRVHTGRKQDDDDANNPSADVDHRYAELDSWQFSPAGETIKVLDKKGNVLHSRYIVPQGSFSSKDIVLIRNADNTRAFMFFPSGQEKAGKIDNGNYLLNFKYRLNIGNHQPVLKRMGGIDSDEDTTIEFSYPAILPLAGGGG